MWERIKSSKNSRSLNNIRQNVSWASEGDLVVASWVVLCLQRINESTGRVLGRACTQLVEA